MEEKLNRVPIPESSFTIVDRVFEKIEYRKALKEAEFPICLKNINDVVYGFPKGEITIISARPSHGKSAFMLQNAWNLAKHGKNVLFISLEDSKERMVERILGQMFKTSNYDLRKGLLTVEPYKIKNKFKDLPLLFEERCGRNLFEINEAYEKTIFDNDELADVIFLDYLQLIDNAGFDAYNKFMNNIGEFAAKNSIAMIIGCQQNRWSVSKDGSVSSAGAKGTGSIEECSDLMLLLYFPYNLNDKKVKYFEDLSPEKLEKLWPHYFEVTVSKNKNGPTKNQIKTYFDGQYFLFEDWFEGNYTDRRDF